MCQEICIKQPYTSLHSGCSWGQEWLYISWNYSAIYLPSGVAENDSLSAQLLTLQVWGSEKSLESEEHASRNQIHAVRWVPTNMYAANLTSLWIIRKQLRIV